MKEKRCFDCGQIMKRIHLCPHGTNPEHVQVQVLSERPMGKKVIQVLGKKQNLIVQDVDGR